MTRKLKKPNPNCPSPIGPCICGPRPAKPEPTYTCSICGWETKHEGSRIVAVRERIVRDHTDLRDCVRHLVDRVQELEWRR